MKILSSLFSPLGLPRGRTILCSLVALRSPALRGVLSALALSCLTAPTAFAQNLYLQLVDLQYGTTAPAGQNNPAEPTSWQRVKLQWPPRTDTNFSFPPAVPGTPQTTGYIAYTTLTRSPTGTSFPYTVPTTGNVTQFIDVTWAYNTKYTYTLNGSKVVSTWGPNSMGVWGWSSVTTPFAETVTITVRKINAYQMQTVDTRIDPRYSTYVAKDFNFGTRTYRGGLFAGYNADGAKVARTYVRFNGLTGPITAGEKLWPLGGLCLYRTRLAKEGTTVPLMCRASDIDTWSPSTLVWSNAPAPRNYGAGSYDVTWPTATDPGKWYTFNVAPDIESELAVNGGNGILTSVLMSPTESNGGTSATFPLVAGTQGWAYFARDNYTESGVAGFTPFLLYAFGGPGVGLSSLSLFPSTVTGGQTSTASAFLPYNAPTGGMTVSLSSDNAAAVVPATVFIPAGSNGANFTITTTAVTSATNVTITAKLGGSTKTATLTVNP